MPLTATQVASLEATRSHYGCGASDCTHCYPVQYGCEACGGTFPSPVANGEQITCQECDYENNA